jgi:hypothetical protein
LQLLSYEHSKNTDTQGVQAMHVYTDVFQYNPKMDDFVYEIASELTEQDQRILLGILKRLGNDGWASWLKENERKVVAFLGETIIGKPQYRIPADSTTPTYAESLLCAYGAILFSQLAGHLGPQIVTTDFEGYARRSEERASLAELAWAARQIQLVRWPVPPLLPLDTLIDTGD